ncbi:protein DDC8 homolog [Herpailurus yagouaroundi]|uniref:protein DDC8 homolog n=1 Tax=Herpailurus yagouaroundi TaxID=1608482 RepID=UPI001AD79712|nr:protein DDC8 homolog [Puma yagouaroundi]
MRRNTGRAAQPCSGPNHEAPLLRRKHRLLQAHERGDLTLQRRQDLQQPRRLAEGPKSGSPSPRARGPERPCLAHLFGAAGGQAREHPPDLERPAQRGAARLQGAGEKHRAERSHPEEPVRLRPQCTKRKAVGTEKQGATKATGLTRRPRCAPEKNKGERVPSTKTGGGRRPADPQVSRGLNMEKLLAAVEGPERLEQREGEGAWDGSWQPGKEARSPVQGLESKSLHQGPQGKAKDLERLWPLGSPLRRGATSPVSLRWHGDRSRWQRELEFASEGLFDTKRKLKERLILNPAPRPGADHSPGGEHGLSGMQGYGGETQRDQKTGGVETEMDPGRGSMRPADADARRTASRDRWRKFLRSSRTPSITGWPGSRLRMRLSRRFLSVKRPGSRAPALGGHRPGSTRWPGAPVALPHKTCQTELAAWHCGPGGGAEAGSADGTPGAELGSPPPDRAGGAQRTGKGVRGSSEVPLLPRPGRGRAV